MDNFVGLDMDERSEGPTMVSSKIPMIRRLKRLLPKIVPTARSGESVKVTALIPVKISGKDVAVASMTAPRNPLLKPVWFPIVSVAETSHLLVPNTAAALNANRRPHCHRGKSTKNMCINSLISKKFVLCYFRWELVG